MSNICSRKRVPRYRLHRASGLAIVTLDGRDHYLGKHGTTASREAYQEKINEWKRSLKDAASSRLAPQEPSPIESHSISVTELIVAYCKFSTSYYCKDGIPTNEVATIKAALKVVRELFGREPAGMFGPKSLKRCRLAMIQKDWSRKHINKQVDRVRRAFKWGVEEELVPSKVYESLRCVTGLKRGRSAARESRIVQPISDAEFDATLEYLPSIVADMLRLQRLTGARPGEICDIRPCDVNRKSDPWEYIPESHKMEHHDRPRVIFIGPKAQRILLPYLLRAAEAYCFSPRETDVKRRAAQHEARTTPISCGNRPGTNRVGMPRRMPGDKYDANNFGRAVRRAAAKAGVSTWSPHRVRHAFATEVRKSHGLEAAQVLLGHSKADVTQIYTARDLVLAAQVARQIG